MAIGRVLSHLRPIAFITVSPRPVFLRYCRIRDLDSFVDDTESLS